MLQTEREQVYIRYWNKFFTVRVVNRLPREAVDPPLEVLKARWDGVLSNVA